LQPSKNAHSLSCKRVWLRTPRSPRMLPCSDLLPADDSRPLHAELPPVDSAAALLGAAAYQAVILLATETKGALGWPVRAALLLPRAVHCATVFRAFSPMPPDYRSLGDEGAAWPIDSRIRLRWEGRPSSPRSHLPEPTMAAFAIRFHGRPSRPLMPMGAPPRGRQDCSGSPLSPSPLTPFTITCPCASMVVRRVPSAAVCRHPLGAVAHPLALGLTGINHCLGCVSPMHSIVGDGHYRCGDAATTHMMHNRFCPLQLHFVVGVGLNA
jgi:hypothetical protein